MWTIHLENYIHIRQGPSSALNYIPPKTIVYVWMCHLYRWTVLLIQQLLSIGFYDLFDTYSAIVSNNWLINGFPGLSTVLEWEYLDITFPAHYAYKRSIVLICIRVHQWISLIVYVMKQLLYVKFRALLITSPFLSTTSDKFTVCDILFIVMLIGHTGRSNLPCSRMLH